MPVKYIVVRHKIPSKPDASPSYYPRLKSSGETTLRELANEISLSSTISQADTMAVIESLIQHIPRHLAEGRIVRLGEFGSFRLSLQAEGSPDADSVSAAKIKRNRLRFRAGKLVREMLQSVVYMKDHETA